MGALQRPSRIIIYNFSSSLIALEREWDFTQALLAFALRANLRFVQKCPHGILVTQALLAFALRATP